MLACLLFCLLACYGFRKHRDGFKLAKTTFRRKRNDILNPRAGWKRLPAKRMERKAAAPTGTASFIVACTAGAAPPPPPLYEDAPPPDPTNVLAIDAGAAPAAAAATEALEAPALLPTPTTPMRPSAAAALEENHRERERVLRQIEAETAKVMGRMRARSVWSRMDEVKLEAERAEREAAEAAKRQEEEAVARRERLEQLVARRRVQEEAAERALRLEREEMEAEAARFAVGDYSHSRLIPIERALSRPSTPPPEAATATDTDAPSAGLFGSLFSAWGLGGSGSSSSPSSAIDGAGAGTRSPGTRSPVPGGSVNGGSGRSSPIEDSSLDGPIQIWKDHSPDGAFAVFHQLMGPTAVFHPAVSRASVAGSVSGGSGRSSPTGYIGGSSSIGSSGSGAPSVMMHDATFVSLLAEELAACHRAHGAAEVKLYSAKAGHDARLVGEALAEIKAIQQRIEQLQRAKALAAGHLVQLPKSARAKTSFSPSERELRVHHAAPEGWGRAPSSRSGTDRIPASRASSSRGSRGSSAASAVSARRLQRQKERDQKRIRTNTTSRR